MEAYVMPSIAVFCCVIGFAIKTAMPEAHRLHDFIPLICAVVGVALMVGFYGFTPDTLATGAVSGIAATGIWEQIIHALPTVQGEHGGE